MSMSFLELSLLRNASKLKTIVCYLDIKVWVLNEMLINATTYSVPVTLSRQ